MTKSFINQIWVKTKYSVTFKRWDVVKDEKFYYYVGVHWKISFLRGGGP